MIFFTVLVLVGLLIGPRVYASGVDSSQPCGSALKVDTAEVFFDASESYTLYAVNSQCFKCSDVLVAYGYRSPTEAEYNASNSCPQLWTPHMWTLKLTDTKGLHVSSLDYTFGSRGRYFVVVDENQQLRVEEIEKPEDVLTPLFSLMGFLAGLTVFVYVADYAWKFFRARKDRDGSKKVLDESMNSPLLSADSSMVDLFVLPHQGAFSSAQKDDKEKPVKPPSNRLGSLDTFRGITLFLMVFVNYGGGHYWFFEHADWNGLTVADLLFPWFMWIMGVSMALSYSNLEKKAIASGISAGQYTWNMWLKAIRRSFVFFAIGMFLNNGNPFYNWRIPGVLQYFAVSYFFAATTVLSMRSQTSKLIEAASSRIHSAIYPEGKSITVNGIVDYFYVLWCYRYEWIIQGVILVVFLSIVFWGKAPGCPVGYNGPGGLSEGSAYWDCTGGIHKYIDEQLFGSGHYYHYPTCQELYDCGSYDPEGFLGSLSACTLTYLGLIAGRALLHLPSHRDRLVVWALSSFILLLLAGILCAFSQNDGIIPVNKNLWSTSFVFVSAGGGLVGLSICYVLVDIYRCWSGAPFSYLGMNSILVYFSHEILRDYFPFNYENGGSPNPSHAAQLLNNFIGAACWLVVAYYCHEIDFFLKV